MRYLRDPPDYFRHLHVPTSDEIVNKVLKRYPKLKPKSKRPKDLIELEVQRVSLVYQIILDKLKFLDQLPKPEELHPFYIELASLSVPYQKYWAVVHGLKRLRKKLEEMWEDYRVLVKTAVSLEEAARIRREAVGRALNAVKRSRGALDVILKFKLAISSLPSIDFNEPRIVVAGMPSTGKSSFVKFVSSAEVEVASYPFTTKEVHVGHFFDGRYKFQVVDTPGILDRTWEEMNEIEKRAAIAIRHLPNSLLFLFDVSAEGPPIEKQARVLDNVLKVVGNERVVLAANKIDVADAVKLREVKELARTMGKNLFELSILNGIGVHEVLAVLKEKALEEFASLKEAS
ncbi:hypothetical protein EYM_07185 [Ignicoccus islandicus DSM 13165]|uniref:GTP-binding protein n=1 Tax=Ignicoccus islandicus DSM 13165 TaxID=940295 RepID=A0A0U3F5A3_9CREN|nr:GTPase [Ignicoccus islandicus]ALU12757.1 hypothetical protein EYM_07185 [Ignicoccus islandicus DSM 13165]